MERRFIVMEKYIIITVFAIINAVGFILVALDKQKARKKLWRIPEKTFFLIALIGGSIGIYVSMLLFRHKTKHWYFMIGIPAIFAAELIILYFINGNV